MNKLKKKQLLPYRIAEWAENYWLEIVRDVGTGALVIATLSTSDEFARKVVREDWVAGFQTTAIISVVVLVMFQGYLSLRAYRHTARISDLRKENEALRGKREFEAAPLLQSFLKYLGEEDLSFGSKPGQSERLSVFRYSLQASSFWMVGRFSNSPEYSRALSLVINGNEGCLAKIWANGWLFESGPDESMGGMKSKMRCGTVIWNRERTRQVGVVLLESTSTRYGPNELESFMKKHEQSYLSELIEHFL